MPAFPAFRRTRLRRKGRPAVLLLGIERLAYRRIEPVPSWHRNRRHVFRGSTASCAVVPHDVILSYALSSARYALRQATSINESVSALKGRHMVAQGAALGTCDGRLRRALKGRHKPEIAALITVYCLSQDKVCLTIRWACLASYPSNCALNANIFSCASSSFTIGGTTTRSRSFNPDAQVCLPMSAVARVLELYTQ